MLRPGNTFVVSLSNHERDCLKARALRQAQGEVQIVRGARDAPRGHRKAADQGVPIQEMMGARVVEATHDLG